MMPFCILIGAMTCYLALSRRLELVVARAAGVSACNSSRRVGERDLLGSSHDNLQPDVCKLRELSKRMEAELFGSAPAAASGRLRFLDQSGQ